MGRFRCMNCNYAFIPKVKDKAPTRCPYCSEFNTLIEEKSLLNDINKEDFDMR